MPPDPMPLSSEVTLIQLALVVAVHRHSPAAATLMLPVPPAAASEPDLGEIAFEQPPVSRPAWRTVKVRPSIVIVPARGLASKFSLTSKVTVASPIPVFEDVTVI